MKKLPDSMTIREAYAPAMEITSQADADEYFEALVQWNMEHGGNSREKAESVERINLGYYAGYYDSATRERVERLFNCVHPVFGSLKENGSPSAEQAIEAGRKMASE